MAVGAVPLQRDPVGAEIAFLEHVHRDAARAGEIDRHAVIGAAIAEQDDVGDAALVQERAEEISASRQNWPR